ncbi:MAG: glutamate ligase domain-containing protein, partial [Mangrovibacterium sp.]
GIIKPHTPIVISESNAEYDTIFKVQAEAAQAPIYFADQCELPVGEFELELKGIYQQKNIRGVLQAVKLLQEADWAISPENIRKGLAQVQQNTKLRGRWEVVQQRPLVVCDTGHNEAGIAQIVQQLAETPKKNLWLVIGMVSDKDQKKVLSLLPQDANYVFTQPSIERAMPAEKLASIAHEIGLSGCVITSVKAAAHYAISQVEADDMVFIGGSTFVVADYFAEK